MYKESKEHIDIELEAGKDDSPVKTEPEVKKEIEDDDEYGGETDKDDDDEYGGDTDVDEDDSKDDMGTTGDDAIPAHTKNLSNDPREIRTSSGFYLKEINGDLFTFRHSLCHCVSRDYKLGKGIAKTFREKFGRIRELEDSGAEIGGVAVLKVRSWSSSVIEKLLTFGFLGFRITTAIFIT